MSSREKEARRIFGERAAFYTTSTAHTDPQVLARVVTLAAAKPDWCALDLATGTGHTAFAVAEKVRQVIASDLTPEMLAEAEKLRASRGVRNVRFEIADVHALPHPDGTFRLITCRRAAHHFSRIDAAVAEMHRVLEPGGRVVIDDRSVPEDDFVDATMNRLDTFHDRSHVREYRPSEWRSLFESRGFAVEAVELYAKHRPVSSFTEKASPEDARQIHALLESLTVAQREAINLSEVNGELYSTHWYVMVAARKV